MIAVAGLIGKAKCQGGQGARVATLNGRDRHGGNNMVYQIEFSSDAYAPYNRHAALYSVQISGSGAHLTVGTPQLSVTTPAHFIELGAWLNQHIITFYADGSLYAFDTQTNGYKQLINTSFYTHIVAVGSQGSH